MGPSDRFERVVTLLQAAATGDVAWDEAARLIAETSGARAQALAMASGQSQIDAEWFYFEMFFHGQAREDLVRRYLKDYWPEDERIPRLPLLQHGRLVKTSDIYTDREKKTSRTYNEMLLYLEAQNGLHVRLDGPGGAHVYWALGDSVERGGWGSDQTAMIGHLLPHVRQYVVVRQAFTEAGALGASLAELLENAGFALVQLDRRGRIAEANDQARMLLLEGDRLMDRRGFLRVRAPAKNSELSRLLESALPPFGTLGTAGSMTLGRRSSRGPLILHVNPVVDRSLHSRPRRVAALAIIVDPATPAPIDPELVKMVLGLTATESRVAVALAAGQSVRDIARSTGRTEQTVRWHMKQIFRKQGISRQVDLVRTVLQLRGGPESRDPGAR